MGAEAPPPEQFTVRLLGSPEIITPEENVPDQDYFLSNLDQNIAVVMKTVYFFDAKEGKLENPAEVLKESLKKVLVPYFPLAGRLGISPQGKLHVEFRNQGVVFVEAESDGNISDLGTVIKPDPKMSQLVYSFLEAKHLLEVPPMTVQVTRFKCGGFVLGLCLNHCMFDGIGAMEFVHSWAETARGEPISVPPHLDRTILKARDPPRVEFSHLEYAEIEDVSPDTSILASGEDVMYASFKLARDKVDFLKNKIMSEGVLEKCTTFEALSALAWHCRTRALCMNPEQKTKLLFAVDYRKRVEPPLPKGFMGNGIMLTYAIATAEELTCRPLSEAVLLVRDAIARIDDKYIRSSIDFFEINRCCPTLFATVIVSTWARLAFHTTDFGWGEPVHSGPVGFQEPQVCLFLLSGKDLKNTNMILGLAPPAMARFKDLLQEIVGDVDYLT